MGNPIKPQNQISFGGVNVNQNDIKSKKVVKENGATRFVIDFKNGTTVKYPAQAAKNNSGIVTLNLKTTQMMQFKRMDGIEISLDKNSKNSNHVSLKGCKNCTVDAQNGSADWVLLGDDYELNRKSSGNKIIQDKQDRSYLNDGNPTFGAGTHIEGQEKKPL